MKILIDLLEVLNTKVPISWSDTDIGVRGAFMIDDEPYTIHLDEYDVVLSGKTYHMVDLGFTHGDDNWGVQNLHKASKVLGAVLNGAVPKINHLKPDLILFGVNNKNKAKESRISLYGRLARLYVKESSFTHESSWITTKNGQYKLLSKQALTAEDQKIIQKIAEETNSKQ